MRSTWLVMTLTACGSDVSYYGTDDGDGSPIGGRWDTDEDGIFTRLVSCDDAERMGWAWPAPDGAVVERELCDDKPEGPRCYAPEPASYDDDHSHVLLAVCFAGQWGYRLTWYYP